MKFGLREALFVALLMVMPVGAWWFVFRPQNTQNAEMRRQIDARQAKLQQLNQELAAIGNLEKEIRSLTGAIDFFESKLPDEKEMDKILQEIWMLAKSNDLNPKSIRTLVRRGAASFLADGSDQAEQLIAIELEGDFEGFYAFLLSLEGQPRIMRIGKMKLRTEEKNLDGNVSANFELSIFFEKKSKEKPWPKKTST